MEDKDQSHTVNNNGVNLPPHDFSGLAEVIEKAKPAFPDTGNGFVPLKDFDPKKPYEDIARHLKDWEERLQRSPLQTDAYLNELKAENGRLAQKHEAQIEQRVEAASGNLEARLEEGREHHRVLMERAARDHDECRQRLSSAEAKRDLLQDERRNDLSGFYESRIQDLVGFHQEVKEELSGQIHDLKSREQTLKERIGHLENERSVWLDERRNWLETRERQFDQEKKEQRDAFVHLRKRVVESEHPDDDSKKTMWQHLASEPGRAGWKALIIAGVVLLLFLGWCVGLRRHWGMYKPQVATSQQTTPKEPVNPPDANTPKKISFDSSFSIDSTK